MSAAFQVGRDPLDRRVTADRRDRRDVDIDPTTPNRRKSDRRDDEVIRPARDLRPLANHLTLHAFKVSPNRFSEQPEPVSAFGAWT